MYIRFTFRFIPCGVLRPSGAYMYTGVLCPDQTGCALQERRCWDVWNSGANT